MLDPLLGTVDPLLDCTFDPMLDPLLGTVDPLLDCTDGRPDCTARQQQVLPLRAARRMADPFRCRSPPRLYVLPAAAPSAASPDVARLRGMSRMLLN